MPLLRRDDPARSLGGYVPASGDDRRPVPPRDTEPRNGRPVARTPYTYRGSGCDGLTGWWDHTRLPVAPLRFLSPLARLGVCEAIDGPGWDRERAMGVDF